MRGLLIRVGIDQSEESGDWNAPVNTETNRFIFVPIRDRYNNSGYIKDGERIYGKEVPSALADFERECGESNNICFQLPARLLHQPMHLDPDFLRLTYGDDGKRGRKLMQFGEDDFLVFYAGLKPICGGRLEYALIGLFTLAGRPLDVTQVPDTQKLYNAHTRWNSVNAGDIVAHGKPGESGLFARCIPIGEWRNRAYRVESNLLKRWGGLDVNDGYLQRSAHLPEFLQPKRFRDWLDDQGFSMHRAQYQAGLSSEST